ncbi:MAG: methyltransferase domain-containing protein [Acidobacteria bacterium]|nr:methyltransferase domain-containing protein [Acidobacteriota bacterium]
MQQTAPVGPERIFQTLSAHQESAALNSAIELEVFTRIAEGNSTAKEIAAACGASERGIRILCDSMTILGFLNKTDNTYSLNDLSSQFLDKSSPSYVGGTAIFLQSDKLLEGFRGLTDAVRNGGTSMKEGSLDPESPMWVKFARGMMGMMYPISQIIADSLGFETDRNLKVLDIAAGHGIFGISIAQKYPNAEIYALDWANVLQVAAENAERFGVATRHHLIEGSAFDVDYGTDYDVILLTNFLHHFDKPTCEILLKKIHGALKEGGKVVTLEFIPNDDRISPPMEAMFSLMMLAGTPQGDAYTFREIDEMLKNSGFSSSEHFPIEGMPNHLVFSIK